LVGGNHTPAWVDEFGLEIGDKCNGVHGNGSGIGYDAHSFTPTLGGSAITNNLFNQSVNEGHFYLQSEWDNVGAACLMRPLELTSASSTASPSSQLVGNPISFSGAVVDPYGEPGFSWSFGDGSTGTGSEASHAYATPGVYTVTMTAKDPLTGSTAAPTERTVVVSSPPTATAPVPTPPPVPTAAAATVVIPNSTFDVKGTFNPKTGVITLKGAVRDPGTFSWLATFKNGAFGVVASTPRCKKGFVRLKGKCRPASIIYGRGSKLVPGPGAVSFTVKPSASALKALRNALKKKKGLPVSVKLTFQSSRGGSPVSHTQAVTVKLKK
jgi:hypothetical protein